jgi:cation diffusion facilitator CzcD-associated flavoprotein CzcO
MEANFSPSLYRRCDDKMTISHYDAIVIGAGISGISAAYHLQTYNKGKSYKILERRQALGGTWDLFNYPGIRSDSDMYTFGFSFRSWDDKSSIAEKHKILTYLDDTVREYGIDKQIQYGVQVVKASWSTEQSTWTLEADDGDVFTCRYIYMCAGYYNYDEAHTPQFDGIEKFKGEIIHPQFWPKEFDYADKNVVIIGSGATAVTLVPNMAETAKHVTMLQRSPTYMGSKPSVDPIANGLSKWVGRWAARWWFILTTMLIYWYCKTWPERAKEKIMKEVKAELGDKFDAKHFTPNYNPWDQRVCLCPDADFFKAIKADKASIETDHIASFNESGISLKSGNSLDADVIVTATGLKMHFFGGIDFVIDGEPLVAKETYVYKGMMLSGVPNTFLAVGYTNASWTLKVDLTHRYASRLINYMDKNNYTQGCATTTDGMQDTALMDLSSGYIQRSLDMLPKQATSKPWRLNQNFILDNLALRFTPVNDEEMVFR